jgi:hypothetical protein
VFAVFVPVTLEEFEFDAAAFVVSTVDDCKFLA